MEIIPFKGQIMRTAILLLCVLLPLPCLAEGNQSIDVTVFAGARIGGSFDLDEVRESIDLDDDTSVGFIIAWPYDNTRQGELLLSHYDTNFNLDSTLIDSPTEVGVSYLHIGGNVPISQGLVPFWFSGGMGATHLSPNDSNLDNETRFSMNFGIHSSIELTESLALRFGARAYATFFDTDSAVFCNGGNCRIYVSSQVWVQSELTAGLTFKF